jgi:hypothetical protein
MGIPMTTYMASWEIPYQSIQYSGTSHRLTKYVGKSHISQQCVVGVPKRSSKEFPRQLT